MALTIIVNSYSFIKEKKPIKFIAMIIMASLFHQTSLIFLVAYFCRYITVNKKTIILGFTIILGMQLIGFQIFAAILKMIYPYYVPNDLSFTSDGMVQTMVILFYFIMGIIIKMKQKTKTSDILYVFVFIAFAIQSFTNRIPMLNRVMWYFYIFIIIFLPSIIDDIENEKIRKYFRYGIITINLAQYIFFSMDMYNVVPYEFLIR